MPSRSERGRSGYAAVWLRAPSPSECAVRSGCGLSDAASTAAGTLPEPSPQRQRGKARHRRAKHGRSRWARQSPDWRVPPAPTRADDTPVPTGRMMSRRQTTYRAPVLLGCRSPSSGGFSRAAGDGRVIRERGLPSPHCPGTWKSPLPGSRACRTPSPLLSARLVWLVLS